MTDDNDEGVSILEVGVNEGWLSEGLEGGVNEGWVSEDSSQNRLEEKKKGGKELSFSPHALMLDRFEQVVGILLEAKNMYIQAYGSICGEAVDTDLHIGKYVYRYINIYINISMMNIIMFAISIFHYSFFTYNYVLRVYMCYVNTI
jgi:hypothetical protein